MELSEVEHMVLSDIDEKSIFMEFEKERLHKAVISLKKRQREVVLLRAYQGHSFKQIGKILKITENSAKVSFHQAKKTLKGKLR